MDEDFLLALQLQEQFDNEYASSSFSSNGFEETDFGRSSKRQKVVACGPLSIVDETWEMLDPSPDVRALFLDFNDRFFWGKLSGVEVKWSPRMTLCAGVCSYEGRGGLCSIRLSEPLLKLRPRKDLVETLLHEMIHALLFVTQNNRDREGHGPEFCKHMNRINKASGTNITIYHSFHDEVDVYRQHWWRCSGPCQNRRPYFGYVKRAMNRAPSALDPWWEDHQRTCGGTYTKIKEPEGYRKKGKTDGKKNKEISEKAAAGNENSSCISTGSGFQDIRNIVPFSGKGFVLGRTSQASTCSTPSAKPLVPVMDVSSSSPISSPKKFSSPTSLSRIPSSHVNPTQGISSTSTSGQNRPIKRSVSNTKVFVNISGSPVRISKPHGSIKANRECEEIPKIRQTAINDLFNNTGVKTTASQTSAGSSGLTGTTSPRGVPLGTHSDCVSGAAGGSLTSRKRLLDECRSSATMFDFFQRTVSTDSSAPNSSSVRQSTSGASSSSSSLTVNCPVCQTKVLESNINQHLDSCLS
ncbi:sprT-like domain-containing protein Spartan [Thalassophryne amazonica]|uniref:sprT-like domain-containing protein Spartan n=1 Tax=Thalassophryne amazonica TaxID=390379 RepID=UPI001470D33A|nr:sprT-like domain-containing protein Spartan [Thalassophryne amazonica]